MSRRCPAGTTLWAAVVLFALWLLTACGSVAGGAGTPAITVTGSEFKFTPSTLHVTAGQPVTISFRNTGTIPHDLVSEGADRNVRLVNVPPGGSQSGTFLASKPGTYRMVCTQPGHEAAGMVGQIVVD
jgi:nitrite reductase (NO-forming)